MEEIAVSIICLVYNHEKYLAQTLDEILKQKVDYKFEVLVHDDNSTDNSREIIEKYQKKYPAIVKPVYEKENQYSRGVKISIDIMLPLVKGKYVAYCEGDDFWCDNQKLSKQIKFLENNFEYVACVHNTKIINLKNNEEGFVNFEKIEKDICIEEIIEGRGNGYQTSSLLVRADVIKKLLNERPGFFESAKVIGDYPLAIFLSLNGKIRYIPDVMSVYRCETSGSWSATNNRRETDEELIDILKGVNYYSQYIYADVIDKKIRELNIELLIFYASQRDEMRVKAIRNLLGEVSLYVKLVCWMYLHFNKLSKLYIKLRYSK